MESRAWEETVDKLEVKPTQPVLMLKQTPLVMYLVGTDFRELLVHPHVFDGIFPEAKQSSPNHNAHIEMTRDVLNQILKALTDPVAVFKDRDERVNSCIFMLELKDANGKTVAVPVQFEASGLRGKINLIKTAFGQNDRWFDIQPQNKSV